MSALCPETTNPHGPHEWIGSGGLRHECPGIRGRAGACRYCGHDTENADAVCGPCATVRGRVLSTAEHIDAIYGLLLSAYKTIFGLIVAQVVTACLLLVVIFQ